MWRKELNKPIPRIEAAVPHPRSQPRASSFSAASRPNASAYAVAYDPTTGSSLVGHKNPQAEFLTLGGTHTWGPHRIFNNPNQPVFPGGGFNLPPEELPDDIFAENPHLRNAAVREFREETGFHVGPHGIMAPADFTHGGQSLEPIPFLAGHQPTFVLKPSDPTRRYHYGAMYLPVATSDLERMANAFKDMKETDDMKVRMGDHSTLRADDELGRLRLMPYHDALRLFQTYPQDRSRGSRTSLDWFEDLHHHMPLLATAATPPVSLPTGHHEVDDDIDFGSF